MNEVLRGASSRQAEIYLEGRGIPLSHSTINNFKERGKFGDAESLRKFALGYRARLLENFGDEVEETCGSRSEEAVEDWFLFVATGLLPRGQSERPPQPGNTAEPGVTYVLDLDNLAAWGIGGAEELTENDKRVLAAMMKAYVEEKRRERGG